MSTSDRRFQEAVARVARALYREAADQPWRPGKWVCVDFDTIKANTEEGEKIAASTRDTIQEAMRHG